MKNLQELKDTLKTIKEGLNDISLDFISDYEDITNNQYICDAFTEYADSNINVYSYNQREFYNNNVDLCERALLEDGYDIAEMMKNGANLDDIICKAGVCGWYRQNYDELSEDESEIIKALAIQYCINNDIDIDIDIDTIEYMNIDSNNRFSDIVDAIEEALEEESEEE